MPTVLQPLRVIVDSKLQTPPEQVLIYAAEASVSLQAAFVARGAEIAFVPGGSGKVDLAAMLDDLARHGAVATK